eukprot:CAMPEP_0175963396 /NCGR_PEP_ID=MMETSP0108-20121206/36995_1 /TAXON_ID=195067 ORGANISM="Goniomonas pacifica, Strain CCMP1869" /NCGR_SAMPLE_ID=MMETSP0108 /ASSEMBLY_ACC=CAM_ASM_000204 /LENGTH=197 /DNA_ID=CAMNT_0017291287 /DNA_START=32 /DNA_END=625 /DNA_ORIENTATION=-
MEVDELKTALRLAQASVGQVEEELRQAQQAQQPIADAFQQLEQRQMERKEVVEAMRRRSAEEKARLEAYVAALEQERLNEQIRTQESLQRAVEMEAEVAERTAALQSRLGREVEFNKIVAGESDQLKKAKQTLAQLRQMYRDSDTKLAEMESALSQGTEPVGSSGSLPPSAHSSIHQPLQQLQQQQQQQHQPGVLHT